MFDFLKRKKVEMDKGSACASLTPAYIFAHDMVLQQNKKVYVYGGGICGRKVTVSFNGQVKSGKVDKAGFWKVALSPMAANSIGQDLTITDGETTIVYNGVLVGEVWFCSGQSNMDYPMGWLLVDRKETELPYEQTVLKDYTRYENWDKIRIYKQEFFPADKPSVWGIKSALTEKSWCKPSELKDVMPHSAYAVGFALRLQEILKIPVGVVVCAVGGSSIEEWLANETIEKNHLTLHYTAETKPHSKLYNGMAYPLNDYAVNGFLWYQGCADCGEESSKHWRKDMIALAAQFRKAHGNVPFISQSLVQYAEGVPFRFIREINYNLSKEIKDFYPVNGIAAGIPYDNIESEGFTNFIHPGDKYGVSRDAAEIAATNVYKKSGYNDVAEYPVVAVKTGAGIEIRFKAGVELKLSEDAYVHNLEGFDGRDWSLIENATVADNVILIPNGCYEKVRYACYNVMMPTATEASRWEGKPFHVTYNSEQRVNLYSKKDGCSDLAITPFIGMDVKENTL